jgi:hypothetical protein
MLSSKMTKACAPTVESRVAFLSSSPFVHDQRNYTLEKDYWETIPANDT